MAGLIVGMLLAAATWAALRRMVRAPWRGWALPLDAAPVAIGFALFLLGTARPVLAGLGVAALGLGLAVADRVKRRVLDEPVVFADRAELLDVVRHPRFYVAFVGWGAMLGGTALCLLAIAALVWIEPPLWMLSLGWQALLALAAAVIGRACFVLPSTRPLVARLARRYARLRPSRDPAEDAARYGLLATCVMHATLARAERPRRRAEARGRGLPACPPDAGPIILFQAESFVDPGRLHPALAQHAPQMIRLRAEASAAGALDVPCWGANTIRTEFETLTGIDSTQLGLDRFNPYERFARVPLPSLASVARTAGYRTICVHPYSTTFYGRNKVMPLLGFDRLIGIEAFADSPHDGGYVTDAALGAFIADLVRAEGPNLFVFAISVENHGPWDGRNDPAPPLQLPPDWAGRPSAAAIGRWLRHAAATDAIIAPLRALLEEQGCGWLGFYGDHRPSLAGFDPIGDRSTDYALWTPGGAPGPARTAPAADLAPMLLDLLARQAAGKGSAMSG